MPNLLPDKRATLNIFLSQTCFPIFPLPLPLLNSLSLSHPLRTNEFSRQHWTNLQWSPLLFAYCSSTSGDKVQNVVGNEEIFGLSSQLLPLLGPFLAIIVDRICFKILLAIVQTSFVFKRLNLIRLHSL